MEVVHISGMVVMHVSGMVMLNGMVMARTAFAVGGRIVAAPHVTTLVAMVLAAVVLAAMVAVAIVTKMVPSVL